MDMHISVMQQRWRWHKNFILIMYGDEPKEKKKFEIWKDNEIKKYKKNILINNFKKIYFVINI